MSSAHSITHITPQLKHASVWDAVLKNREELHLEFQEGAMISLIGSGLDSLYIGEDKGPVDLVLLCSRSLDHIPGDGQIAESKMALLGSLHDGTYKKETEEITYGNNITLNTWQ